MGAEGEELSRDTRPLEPEQLSDDELLLIRDIEVRLAEARTAELEPRAEGRDHYLATTHERRPRVLLLDGARGTGKTSLLLTLVRRWRCDDHRERKGLEAAYEHRAASLAKPADEATRQRVAAGLSNIPDHVLPVAILDFDPLPPGMPVMAGLVEAWRPLAERCEATSLRRPGGEAEDARSVPDLWHALFRMAAAGWSEVSEKSSLIEQVLDREVQVQDWLNFTREWRRFVDEVIRTGENLPAGDRLPARPVFVVVIDDCDLQVARIRELLPALRMLYHPRVFFLVAADQPHMLDMLKLEFVGQQRDVARGPVPEPSSDMPARDWAMSLARASFDKVFQRRNRFKLRRLSLGSLLSFPLSGPQTFAEIIGDWRGPESPSGAAEYLDAMARLGDEVGRLPPVMSYRTAHQLLESARTEAGAALDGVEAIAQILNASSSGFDVTVVQRRGRRVVDYPLKGELTAHFEPEHVRDVAGLTEAVRNVDIVTSSRLDFRYRPDRRARALIMSLDREEAFNFTPALLAVSLREDQFPIEGGPSWNVRLAFAWTSISMLDPLHADAELDLSFRWPFPNHPSPKQLLEWTRDWAEFVHDLRTNEQGSPDRTAYAWVYFNVRWAGLQTEGVQNPLVTPYREEDWDNLLSAASAKEGWLEGPLPLLARPEIGLSPSLQLRILNKSMQEQYSRTDLRIQRRRLITDAIVAASEQEGSAAENPEAEGRVDQLVQAFDKHHEEIHGSASPWFVMVGS